MELPMERNWLAEKLHYINGMKKGREWGYFRGTIQMAKWRKSMTPNEGSKLTHISVQQEEICASVKCSKKNNNMTEWVTPQTKERAHKSLKRARMNPKAKGFFFLIKGSNSMFQVLREK